MGKPARSKGGFGDNPQNINRKGAPLKDNSWAGVLRAATEEMAGNTNLTKKEAIVTVLLGKAAKGDLTAIKMIMDRMDGLCVAKQEIKSENKLIIEEEIIE
jgi:hypothetical protein